ncbi:MAG: toxin-antitoxin system HicB family antitoxin [Acidobacteriia bacterium]|nr:toxin-antitoxin system HicB family antitoxin [Terriglobia bacterium]
MDRTRALRGGGPAPTRTYPLRLPRSLKEAVERLSKADGTSMNQFVAIAVAEKVSALRTAMYFEDRKVRADFKAFDKIMKRRRGKSPRQGDEMPA